MWITSKFYLHLFLQSSFYPYQTENPSYLRKKGFIFKLTFSYFMLLSLAFCIGVIPVDCPLPASCFALNSAKRDGPSVTAPQLLFLSSMSAVSRIGSRRMEATSLSFINAFVTVFSFNLHTCAGMRSISFEPSL